MAGSKARKTCCATRSSTAPASRPQHVDPSFFRRIISPIIRGRFAPIAGVHAPANRPHRPAGCQQCSARGGDSLNLRGPFRSNAAGWLVSPLTKLDMNSGLCYAEVGPFCTEGRLPMRGRSRAMLSIAPADVDSFAHDRSQWFLALVSGATCQDRLGNRRWGTSSALSLPGSNVTKPPFGEPVNGIARVAWRACSPMVGKAIRVVRSRSPPCNGHRSLNWPVWSRLPRGCTSPIGPARTWPAKQWRTGSSPPSARPRFAASCSDVDLQPHRTRYWKTARLDARFKERAEQVLWCYANAARLGRTGHLGGVCR